MGGDESVILMPGMKSADLQEKVAALEHAVIAAATSICPDSGISLSVGIAQFPADGRTGEQLLAEADHRMYQCKQRRKRQQRRATAAEGLSAVRPAQSSGRAGAGS